jgi:HEPN domain-containing protein
VDRTDFQVLSRVRLKEAKVLLAAGLYDGAYYLAGYAVECALKACIAKATRRHEFPDRVRVNASYTHDITELMVITELRGEARKRADRDPEFEKNWDTVRLWSEKSRYARKSADAARELLKAITERDHGVFTWLRRCW